MRSEERKRVRRREREEVPPAPRRRFRVTVTTMLELDLDPKVLSQGLDESFRKQFYVFENETEVVEHLAYNVVANRAEFVSELDGWANMEAGAMKMGREDVVVDQVVDLDEEEKKPPAAPQRRT